jgi:hypothetical protein
MAGMRQSLPGLAKTATRALKSSRDDLACMAAFSICEMVDNLRKVKNGEATVEDFFAVYVFDSCSEKPLATLVRREEFYCMRDEPEDDEDDSEAA